MSQSFGNLRYELAENFIYNQKEETMKFQILTFFFKRLCRKAVAIDYFYENLENIRASENTNIKIANDLTEKYTKQIIFVASNSNFSFVNRFRPFLKESIYLLALQVCDLLKKETVAKDNWMNVSLLMKNLSMTRQGTVNLMKTVHQILTTEQLDPSHSCELACYYFITDEVVNNHYEMVINQKSSYFEGHTKYEALKDCLIYWKWFILNCEKEKIKNWVKNTDEMLQNAVFTISNYKTLNAIVKIFENSVRYNNEIAVHYLWTNFISKIKNADFVLRKLLVDFTPSPLHININMFLLFQIDIEKILSCQKFNYLLILENIFRNFRWKSLFIKTLNGFKSLFDLNSFLNLLNILIVTHSFDFSTEINIIIEFINSFPSYVQECLSVDPQFFYNNVLKKSFIYAKQNLLNSLLKTYSKKFDFRVFLLTDSGSDLIVETIKNGNIGFINNFIHDRYIRSDVINLKRFWFYGKGEILYKYFIEVEQFESLCAVIDWLYEGEPESLQGFKERMLNRSKGLYLKNSIFRSNVDSDTDLFASVNEFLLWSLKTKESIYLFKRNINLCPNPSQKESENLVSCYDELITWILESKWDLIELFFSWKDCLFYEKRLFLRNLINDDDFITEIILKARNSTVFFNSFIVFLKMQLYLNDSDMKVLKGNVFEAVLEQNRYFSDFLRQWYENSGSADELNSHIQSTGIEFLDCDILDWLVSKNIMSFIANLSPE
ncbi:UNVERIFIED_CONTAM: hypothetical protein RMT77_011322 [Armadillidium vulgare]